jgi:hypothetical protein
MSSSRTTDRRRKAPPGARAARLRSTSTASAAFAALAAANPDDDGADVAAFAKADHSSIEAVLLGLLLDAAIPLRLRRRLERGDPICIALTAPGPTWCAPICAAVNSRFPKVTRTARDGSSRADRAQGTENATVAAALRAGHPVIGVSHAPTRFLPSALLSAADANLTVRAPTGRQMRKLLRASVGGRTPRAIADDCAAGLDFEEILAAFRSGASARAVVDNLDRARASKTRLSPDDDTPPLDKLAGYGEAKAWGLALADGIAAWRRREIAWSALSAAVLCGPPGTGKTLFARSLAKTLGVPIVATSVGGWFATTSGHLDSMTRAAQAAWDSARALAPAILFIDELDSIPDRRTLSDRNRDWWTPLVNFILTLFDGAQTSREGIILLGATNNPDRLDPALVRPGRFDRLIAVPPPGVDGLTGILRYHLGDDLAGADLAAVARLRPDATGADAAGWVRDAHQTARLAGRPLAFDDLLAQVLPPETRPAALVARIARHEAAHAVVGHWLGAQTVDSVSLSTPGADGAARFAADPATPLTRAALEAMVVTALAGRANDESDGAADAGSVSDLAKSTTLLAGLHRSFGLGDTLIVVGGPEDMSDTLRFDPALRATVEADLQRLYAEAQRLVAEHGPAIDLVAAALARRRFLSGDEVRALIRLARRAPRRPAGRAS